MQILVLIGKMGASPHIGEILPFCDYFDCPVRPVLLFSGTRTGQTAEPIFAFHISGITIHITLWLN